MINRAFFKKQILNIYIRIIITSLIVCNLKIIKHKIHEYIILSIYVYDKNNVIEKLIQAYFIKEMHIVDDFKINILIKNNVDEFKNISIFSYNKTAYINNCEIIILLKIKIIEIIIDKLIHLRKTTIILFKIELLIETHHFTI